MSKKHGNYPWGMNVEIGVGSKRVREQSSAGEGDKETSLVNTERVGNDCKSVVRKYVSNLIVVSLQRQSHLILILHYRIN
jgi:hypothetical protein